MKDFEKIANVFKAFDDEKRLCILEMLQSGEKCACVILENMQISQSTLSHHMKILCESGIVNGRKEGDGKEFYFNKRIKFEGSYSKGIKVNGTGYDKFGNEIYTIDNNIVTEKYKNGNRVFEGSYYNGKKWTGVWYDINGNVAYNIKCGKGFVKEFFDDGVLKFEGEYDNGERNGKGKRYDYENKEVLFEGEYLNGEKWNGKGKEYYLDQDEIDDVDEYKMKYPNHTTGYFFKDMGADWFEKESEN